MTLREKLLKVRESCMYMQKDKQGYQFKYSGADAIFYRVNQSLIEHRLDLVISAKGMPTIQRFEYEGRDGPKARYEILIPITFTIYDLDSDEKDEWSWVGWGTGDDSKAAGAMGTYSAKYSLYMRFLVARDELDMDSYERQEEAKDPSKQALVREELRRLLTELRTQKSNADIAAKADASLKGIDAMTLDKMYAGIEWCSRTVKELEG
jgi:hypothetical protein